MDTFCSELKYRSLLRPDSSEVQTYSFVFCLYKLHASLSYGMANIDKHVTLPALMLEAAFLLSFYLGEKKCLIKVLTLNDILFQNYNMYNKNEIHWDQAAS